MTGFSEIMIVILLILVLYYVVPSIHDAEFGKQSLLELQADAATNAEPISNERLQKIVERLSGAIELQYSLAVFVQNDDKHINAASLSGGYIIITSKLLDTFESGELTETQMAAVLAHEVGHSELGHGKTSTADGLKMKISQTLAGLVSKSTPATAAINVGGKLLQKSQSRQYEIDADRFATKLLIKAGYEPESMVAFLELLQRQGASSPRWAELFSTHPYIGNRIEAIRREVRRIEGLPPADRERLHDEHAS